MTIDLEVVTYRSERRSGADRDFCGGTVHMDNIEYYQTATLLQVRASEEMRCLLSPLRLNYVLWLYCMDICHLNQKEFSFIVKPLQVNVLERRQISNDWGFLLVTHEIVRVDQAHFWAAKKNSCITNFFRKCFSSLPALESVPCINKPRITETIGKRSLHHGRVNETRRERVNTDILAAIFQSGLAKVSEKLNRRS